MPQDAECFICRSSIEGKGIVRGCACRGTMGLAHLACLVRQAEASVKEQEEWGTGEGINKWSKCFDCGQHFHGALFIALGWAAWKTYLGRPVTDRFRAMAQEALANALWRGGKSEEALPVIEANLALKQLAWSYDESIILGPKTCLANVLGDLGRHDEALVLTREIYAKRVAGLGVSHDETITCGLNLAGSLIRKERWDEGTTLLRNELLPVARQSLGSDANSTLMLYMNLVAALRGHPKRTRDDLRLNPTTDPCKSASSTRPDFDPNTGENLLEAETIMRDVIQRRRRILGPAHPITRDAEEQWSRVRASLARRHHA